MAHAALDFSGLTSYTAEEARLLALLTLGVGGEKPSCHIAEGTPASEAHAACGSRIWRPHGMWLTAV